MEFGFGVGLGLGLGCVCGGCLGPSASGAIQRNTIAERVLGLPREAKAR